MHTRSVIMTEQKHCGSPPSPLPSPAGRGGIARGLSRNPAMGFAKQVCKKTSEGHLCSLSQRERVRVRENSPIFNAFQSFFCICLLSCCVTTNAESAIFVDGLPVEIKISELSAQTVRIELAPLDKQGNPQHAVPSPVLVDFPTREKFRARELTKEKQLRVGKLRVTLKPQPLTVAVRRADGRLIQEIVFNE